MVCTAAEAKSPSAIAIASINSLPIVLWLMWFSALFQRSIGPLGLRPIEIGANIRPILEFLIELTRFQNSRSPAFERGGLRLSE